MRTKKRCAFCGKEFTPNSGMQKYCSEECQSQAKAERKRKQSQFLRAAEPMMDVMNLEYLTFAKAAVLMGCSRQYVYKLVAEGKLKASRISSRMSFVRKADIETMLAGNPYHRVLLGTSAPRAKKQSSKKDAANGTTPSSATKNSFSTIYNKVKSKSASLCSADVANEPLDYISGEDVMARYKVKKSWLYASAKNNGIPICKIAGVNYYSRKHLDDLFGVTAEIENITDWVTTEEAETQFDMKREALRAATYRHHIPTKREYGKTYYSRQHIADLLRPDIMNDDRYCTVEHIQQQYGYTRSNILHIIKVNKIDKVKVGVRCLVLKTDIYPIMEQKRQQAQT